MLTEKTTIYFDAQPIAEKRLSGIGHMTLELIRALDIHKDNGKSFKIILVAPRDRRTILESYKFKNITIEFLPVRSRILNLLWKFDLLPPMDRLLGYGVYVFPNYKNWKLSKSKSLTFVCDVSFVIFPKFVQPDNLRFLSRNIDKWIKRTDKVICISENAQKEIISNLSVEKSKTAIVSCGVDREKFYPRNVEEVKKFQLKYKLPKNYILYLGNIEPRKNINTLLRAYVKLPRLLQDKHALVIVGGGGWLNETILDEIETLKKQGHNIIKPSKYIAEDCLPALHTGASLLVHPAYYEGFGISPLQAMSCGTPVIVANNSSMPEVAGEAGILFSADDIEDLSAKIESVLSDSRFTKGLSKRSIIQSKKFLWSKSAESLLKEAMKR